MGALAPESYEALCAIGGGSDRSDESACFVDPTLDEGTPGLFARAGQGRLEAPTWVYPIEASRHPPNLPVISFHFTRTSQAQNRFQLVMRSQEKLRVLYFPCLSGPDLGCVYRAPEGFWGRTARYFAGETVELELTGLDDTQVPTQTVVSRISFAAEDVRGGLYYWSANPLGLYRLLLGGRQAVPFVTLGGEGDPDACAGCHSLSRDGGTIAYTIGKAMQVDENAAFAGWLRVSRVTSMDEPILATPPTEESDSAMMALSSDGSWVAVAYQDELRNRLVLRETNTGKVLDEFESADGKVAMFPEFSPDSSALVVTLAASLDSEIAVRDGNISVLAIADGRFGTVTEVVPAEPETAHYYPTWSPDGEWIAFVSGPGRPAEEDPEAKSYDQRASRVRLVHRTGGTSYELRAASGPPKSTSTWPKFSPFVQCVRAGTDCPVAERNYFLTFSSRRDYGILAPSADGVSASSQLWLAAIDLSRLSSGDPSLPPIWLPYQNERAANHLGFWTEALKCNERVPCSLGTECVSGNCVVVVK